MIMIILIGIVFFAGCITIASMIIFWKEQNAKTHKKQIQELVNNIIKENMFINSSLGILEANLNYNEKLKIMEKEHVSNQQWDGLVEKRKRYIQEYPGMLCICNYLLINSKHMKKKYDKIYREALVEIEKRKRALSNTKQN